MSDKATEEKNKLKKNQSSDHNSSSVKRHGTVNSHGSVCSWHRHRPKEDIYTGPKQYEKKHRHYSDERKSSDSAHSRSVRSISSHSKHEQRKYSADLYGANRKHRSTFETISEKSVTLDNPWQRDVEYKGLNGERRGDRGSVLYNPSKKVKQTCQKIEATPSTYVESVFGESVNRTYRKSSRSMGGNFSTDKDMREDGILNKDKFTVPKTQPVGLTKISSMKFSVPDTNTYLFSDYEGDLSTCSGISQLSGKDHQMKCSGSPFVGEVPRSYEVPLEKNNDEIHMLRNTQYIGLALLEKGKLPDEKVQSNIEETLKDALASSLRGLLLHIMFLATITTIAVGMTTVETFYLTDITQKIFYDTPPQRPLTTPTPPESTTIFPQSTTIIATHSQTSTTPKTTYAQTVTSSSETPTTQTTLTTNTIFTTKETETTEKYETTTTTTVTVPTTESDTTTSGLTSTTAESTTEAVPTTEEDTSTTGFTSSSAESTTEAVSTTESDTTTTGLTSTTAESTTEAVPTTEGDTSTTGLTSTTAESTTEAVPTTEGDTSTTGFTSSSAESTTEAVPTTEGDTSTTGFTSSSAESTTEAVPTTEGDTSTTGFTSSSAESTTEAVPTTGGTSTTGFTSSSAESTTEAVPTTEGDTTTSGLSSTTAESTTEAVPTTEEDTSTTGFTSSSAESTTEAVPTTEGDTSTTGFTSSSAESTTEAVPTTGGTSTTGFTSSSAESTTEAVPTTEGDTTTSGLSSTTAESTTEAVPTTEGDTSTTGLTSTTAESTTEAVPTTEGDTSTTGFTSSSAESTTEAVPTTEGDTSTTGLTSTTAESTTEAVPTTEGDTSTTGFTSSSAESTTEAVPTTGGTSTTGFTSSSAESTTEAVPTTEGDTSTSGLSSTTAESTTEAVPTTESDTSTTGFTSPTAESTTEAVPTTGDTSTTGFTSSSAESTTEAVPTTEEDTSTTGFTSSSAESTTEAVPTTESDTSTTGFTSSSAESTTEAVPTTEEDTSTTGFTSITAESTTEAVPTTEEDTSTTGFTSSSAESTTEAVPTTEEDTSTTGFTISSAESTTEAVPTTEEDTSTTGFTSITAESTTEAVPTTEEDTSTTGFTSSSAESTTEAVPTTEEDTSTTGFTISSAESTTEAVPTTEEDTSTTGFTSPTAESTTEAVPTTEEDTSTTGFTISSAESTREKFTVPSILPTGLSFELKDEILRIRGIPITGNVMGDFNIESFSRNSSFSSAADTSPVIDRGSYLTNDVNEFVNSMGDVNIGFANGILTEKIGNFSTKGEKELYSLWDISDVVPSVGHGLGGRILDNLTSITSARKVDLATEPVWRQYIYSKKFPSGSVHHRLTSMNLSLERPVITVTMNGVESTHSKPVVASPLFYDLLDMENGSRSDTVKDMLPLDGTESVFVDDVTEATKLARDIITGRKIIPMEYPASNIAFLPNVTDVTSKRTIEQVSARSMTGNLNNILKGALQVFSVKNSSRDRLVSKLEGFTHMHSNAISSSGRSGLPSTLGKTTASALPFSNLNKVRAFSSAGRFTSLYNSHATTMKMSQGSGHSSPLFTTKESFQSPSTYHAKSFLPVPFLYMSDMPSSNEISESAPSVTSRMVFKRNNTLLSLVSARTVIPQKGLSKTDNCVIHGGHCVYIDKGNQRKELNDLRLRSGSVDRVSQNLSLLPLSLSIQDLEPYFELRGNENISVSVAVKRQTDEDIDIKCKSCPEKGLRDSYSVHDFWQFAESTLIHFLYWRFWYKHSTPPDHVPDDDKKYFFENQIIGVPRMRQVRVKNDSCKIHPDVSRFFDECFYYYSLYTEETRPIREDMDDSITASAWRYTSYEKLKSTFYWGKFSLYGGGGYYLDFSNNVNETQKMIRELKEKTWITKSTRAVFIDFTIYNVNVNLFCVCKIVLEFPPSGGMIPNADFVSLKLLRYLTPFDFFILGLELFFVVFVIFLSLETIADIKEMKIRFFKTVWSYVDITVVFLSYIFIAYSMARFYIIENFVHSLPEVIEEYVEFTYVRNIQLFYNYLTAVLVFFAWLRLLKFITISKTMAHLHDTLQRSAKDIFGFAVMFLILFYAFALVAYLIFGNKVENFSTFWSSCMSLLQGLIGEFEYKEIEEVNRIIAPIFLIVFVFFMFFILMNMFLAIINDAYASVKSEYDAGETNKKEHMHNAFMNFIGCCCCGLDKKLERKRKNKRTYDEIKYVLKRSGFSDAEIEVFLSKYNIDVSQLVNDTENRRIIHDLELEGLDFSQNAYQSDIEQLRRRVDRLGDRVQEMQKNLQPVLDKIDLILYKLKP